MANRDTILFVDDDDLLRDLGTLFLQRAGYHVLLADSGPMGLAVASRHAGEIPLLITDATLAELSGCQLARVMKKTRPATKVIFVSGYPLELLGELSDLASGEVFLQKPYDPAQLIEFVHAQLYGKAYPFPTGGSN